jgi:SAM-dependent methyltransferase
LTSRPQLRRIVVDGARRAGLRRSEVIRSLPVPDRAVPPYILNAVCHPRFWDDPEWLMVLRQLDLDQVHRKAWEWTQCVFGLERLGVLGPQTRVLGVGAGHEVVLYYLANRCAEVIGTDLYEGDFASSLAAEADPGFVADPSRYAPFPYRQDRLAGMVADGRNLPFPDDHFDVVYSLSSIEHFGGHEAAAQAMREMRRVVRPGGIVCVATELLLQGDDHEEFFTREELQRDVIEASGLVPVEQLHEEPIPRELLEDPVWMDGDVTRVPHIVMALGEHRWTSVILFLRRPTNADLARGGVPHLVGKVRRRLRPSPR